jgi:hypothetical protein
MVTPTARNAADNLLKIYRSGSKKYEESGRVAPKAQLD